MSGSMGKPRAYDAGARDAFMVVNDVLMSHLQEWETMAGNWVIASHPELPHTYTGGVRALRELVAKLNIQTKCDGNHAQSTVCIDPECWQRESSNG